MIETIQNKHISAVDVKPIFFPVTGFLLGMCVWLVDALVDIYVLGEEQSLFENIFYPEESTEIWMRSLVLIIFVIMGFLARHILLKHIKLDKLLLEYQRELELNVSERTRELLDKTLELEQYANYDMLTSLYNRRKFSEILEYELDRFSRYNKPFCLINIDIDFFKKVNDTYGHDVGDKVIKEFCHVLKSNIRKVDTAGRWGGEEFLLLIIEVDEKIALTIADNVLQAIHNIYLEPVGKVTASIGVTVVKIGDYSESIVTRSDQALYKAKNNGRDRIEVL